MSRANYSSHFDIFPTLLRGELAGSSRRGFSKAAQTILGWRTQHSSVGSSRIVGAVPKVWSLPARAMRLRVGKVATSGQGLNLGTRTRRSTNEAKEGSAFFRPRQQTLVLFGEACQEMFVCQQGFLLRISL
jgi:hypothetical protein